MSRLSSRLTGRALAASGGALAIPAIASVALLAGGSPASAHSTQRVAHRATTASAGTKISAHKTRLGEILVDPKGETVYAFSKDTKNKDVCISIRGCISVWPITAVNGKLTAGAGVKQSMLGTITVQGKKQATYNGHPLYGYVGNDGPADVDYVGISQSGGTWPAVSPTGKLIQ
jgi:predicted lipoprotein with Yx(FWY)xxD motif